MLLLATTIVVVPLVAVFAAYAISTHHFFKQFW